MNDYEKHELRIKYLDVLLRNGESLHSANKYIDDRLDDAGGSRKEAIAHALEMTAIEKHKEESQKVEDFSMEEQIIANAYVAGEKLKNELKEKKEIQESLEKETDWKDKMENSKNVEVSEETKEKFFSDFASAVENDEVKIPPKDEQTSFDFVNPSPEVPFGESDSHVSVEVDDGPKMVDPKGDKTVIDNRKKPVGGIRESSPDQLGQTQEIPLRYEDRIKQSQQR